MQTFVPFSNLKDSVAAIDNKRLNKQLLEGRQIYNILASGRRTGAWVNHPAVKMWRNYDMALFQYLEVVKEECDYRGIKTDNNWKAILDIHESNWNRGSKVVMPAWWGDSRVHESHRNNLYIKDSQYYAMFSKDKRVTCCDKCNYFWPTHTSQYAAEFLGYISA